MRWFIAVVFLLSWGWETEAAIPGSEVAKKVTVQPVVVEVTVCQYRRVRDLILQEMILDRRSVFALSLIPRLMEVGQCKILTREVPTSLWKHEWQDRGSGLQAIEYLTPGGGALYGIYER